MKKGIRGHDVRAKGIKSISERCKEVGIEYVQLVMEKSIEGFSSVSFSKEYAESIKNDLGDVKIAVLGSYINPSCPDNETLRTYLNKFKEKIAYASVLSPIVVGTETGTYIEGKTHTEEAYQFLLKNIKELVAEAEKYNVKVGIEGVHLFVINTPQMLSRLIKDVDSENILAIFDPCNYINIDNYKDQDKMINSMFDLLADKICCIHAKDFVIENGKMKRVDPGEGLLNYDLIFKRAKECGLDVPVICEEINEDLAVSAFERLSRI